MPALVRALFMTLVRFFYREIAVRGAQHVPKNGPCLVVANHPNGLIDPLILRVAVGKPVAFLAKSTLFGNPFGRLVTGAFSAIPVYRQKDGSDTSKNEETFERCRALFREKGWLAMFPEGTSHSDPAMRPMKTGAARIALSAEAQGNWLMGLTILPAGMLFDAKDTFRSRVAVCVGAPISVAAFKSAYETNERGTVEELTAKVGAALADVTLQAESTELWEGFVAVASWTQPGANRDLGAATERARALAQAYLKLRDASPDDADALVNQARRFVQTVGALGVRDPWSLDEAQAPTLRDVLIGLFPILTLWPLALVGAVLNWLPYRLLRPLSVMLAKGESDIISTIKLLGGLLFMPVTWFLETWAAGFHGGPIAALAMLVLAPLSGFVAMRFDERLELRRALLRTYWLRTTRARVAEAVSQARRELAGAIQARLDAAA